jgi:cation diffusion facilitator family transporter
MEVQKQDTVERRALVIGAVGNLIMAGIAWITYWFSNSEAILLDGNYSFIVFLGMGVALAVARVKSRRTETFPLGQFFYEALYSFMKGLMILGVILMAVVTSIVRIIFYVGGNTESIPMLNPDPILYYAVSVAFLCFVLSGFYRLSNAKIGGQSSLLKTDGKASFVDGMLSLGIAVGVLALRNTDPSGSAGFVPFLADSIITLVIAAMLINKPVEIIRESIIELALGRLQDEDQYNQYDRVVREECAPQFAVDRLYMSKTGSRYLAVALVRPADGSSQVSLESLRARKEAILERLRPEVPHLMVELVPTP